MLSRDFKEFAESLAAHRVECLVVGGYALAAHGHPRYTGDIDFWIRPEPQNPAPWCNSSSPRTASTS